jgi:hypothetical protein
MDVFNFQNTQNNNFVFYANGSTTSWQTWNKPRNVKFVSIFAISGGGGGGGGRASGTVINAAGGGGGASSGTALGIFPANSIPDTLYIQVGLGGTGGISQNSATAGSITYVSAQPNTTSINVIIAGTATGPNGGAGGQAGGTGGGAPTAFNKTSTGLLGASGMITSTAGWAGVNGGTAVSGTSIVVSGFTTGGAGGGGNTSTSGDTAGGNITGIGIVPTIIGGVSGGTAGYVGYNSVLPFVSSSISVPMFFTGGSGGGSKFNGVGGNGGDGGYGCGGGGAGSGLTGGVGGKGGNGLVIITCW